MNDFLQSVNGGKLVKLIFVFVCVLIFFVITLTLNSLKEYRFIGDNIPPMNVITVSGEGEVFAVPDIARFTFTVNEEKSSVKEAQDEVSRKISAVLEALKNEGIEEKDIKTISYNAYPRYEYRDSRTMIYPPAPIESTRVLIGYNVSQTVEVKIRDTAKAGEILGEMGSLGITDMSGLFFTIDDEEELMREARAIAIANAKEKAKELSRDLGVSLKRVVSFSEMDNGYYPYARKEALGMGGMDTAVVMPSVEVPSGESQIMSRVMISYEIR